MRTLRSFSPSQVYDHPISVHSITDRARRALYVSGQMVMTSFLSFAGGICVKMASEVMLTTGMTTIFEGL